MADESDISCEQPEILEQQSQHQQDEQGIKEETNQQENTKNGDTNQQTPEAQDNNSDDEIIVVERKESKEENQPTNQRTVAFVSRYHLSSGIKRQTNVDDNHRLEIVTPCASLIRSMRPGSVDDSYIYDRNKSTVYDYLASSFNSASPIVRSNSFTHQDIGRHRATIQASFASGLVTNEEDEDLLLHQKARRLSKSLPELNQLRTLPQFAEAANQYNVIFESDQDDDEEDNTSSCIATDTEYHPAWANKSDFFLTVMGFSLAINTFWRLPYFCYINDGGSFLMVYTFLMFFVGLPLLCMEYAIGQLTHRNLIVFAHLCPLLKGIVISLALTSSILIPLYSTINTWSMLYFFKSFHQIPPWSRCSNKWNTEPCLPHHDQTKQVELETSSSPFVETTTNINSHELNSNLTTPMELPSELAIASIGPSAYETTLTFASQQFFDNRLLDIDLEAPLLGVVRWDLAIILFFIWFIIFIALRKSYVFSSNPTFCLAIVPAMVFGILFFKAIFLPGSRKGLIYFFKPSWEGICQPNVWLYAAGFTLHSLGTITGLSLGMAKFHRDRNNLMRDSIYACLLNYFALWIVGATIFATLGNIAHERQMDITQVVTGEPGLAYVVISELLSSMPMRTLWSCFFFFLLFCLGVDYQIALVANVVDCIKDIWRSSVGGKISHQLIVFTISLVFFSFSLFFITQKGIVLVRVTEHYVTVILTVILALLKVLLVGNFYGARNLVNAIRLVTCKAPGFYFSFCWKMLTPFILLIILASNLYYYQEFQFRKIKDSFMIDLLGPVMVITTLSPIPVFAFHELRRKNNSDSEGFLKRLTLAFKPEGDPIKEMKQGNIGAKRQDSFSDDDVNPREHLSFDIVSPVIGYSLIQGLYCETTI